MHVPPSLQQPQRGPGRRGVTHALTNTPNDQEKAGFRYAAAPTFPPLPTPTTTPGECAYCSVFGGTAPGGAAGGLRGGKCATTARNTPVAQGHYSCPARPPPPYPGPAPPPTPAVGGAEWAEREGRPHGPPQTRESDVGGAASKVPTPLTITTTPAAPGG
ncbi:hypothetical protein GWK47_002704 [Chionoecetes opilio]|uniref:Uncharacterized protein n=1 Tax=Chionoecetes opilio TaxID=41210 RepID=A0A8J4XLM1_CHIOP|nr:hypothetical protein GWK47_002704 [Chionoecetes opilio]